MIEYVHLFTGLNLYMEQDGDTFTVSLEGDSVKELYSGPDKEEAQRIYNSTVEHYTQREASEPPADYHHYEARA